MKVLSILAPLAALLFGGCLSPEKNAPADRSAQVWTTSPDGSKRLSPTLLPFAPGRDEGLPALEIDTARRFQTVDGFGYTLTGGSAFLLRKMPAADRAKLLLELFGNGDNDLKISCLRISIGASDLDAEVFSYDDLPAPGDLTDPDLRHFNLSKDTSDLLPVLKEILALRPDLKIIASPWSAPVWMKTNGSSIGGSLKPAFYGVYARYFVKYVAAMAERGIRIWAVTVQNEPQHGGNNPSMVMSAAEQADFVKNHLGPAFREAKINTKIIVWDHNCDRPDFPLAILDDPAARAFVDGSAFHLYAGEVSALSAVHERHPDKNLYFTEQWTGAKADFGGDLRWHLKNVVIGTMRNHARAALEWNLANDPAFGPHTPGGCTECRGALTLDGAKIERNVSYFIIAHASRFVPPGSVRVGSSEFGKISNVAFRTPAGKTVLLALNDGEAAQTFQIHCGEKWLTATLAAGHAATVVW